MSKPIQQGNTPSFGLNRDNFITRENEYSELMNGLFESNDGQVLALTVEPSNLLAFKHKEGFKVVGFLNDIDSNKTYYFIHNSTTKVSEIGYSKTVTPKVTEEEYEECSTCNKLDTPLENIIQDPLEVYITLLTDECHIIAQNYDKALNFDLDNPVKDIEIKKEKEGDSLYFAHSTNPPRKLALYKLEEYQYFGEVLCGEDQRIQTCINVDKLRIFKQFKQAVIQPELISIGGRLKKGTYEFLIAYCDEIGNEVTDYTSITNPIQIFDLSDTVMEQSEIADQTNYAIKLNISNLDTTFTHYKIVVIQNADIEGVVQYFEEGVHSTSDTTVFYDTEKNKKTTTLNDLVLVRPTVKTWEGLTQSNNILFGRGISYEEEWNLQPIANLLGGFVEWQTHIANEGFYKNGINTSLFTGYQRDEVVPLSIRFITSDGYRTALFPLVGRPSETEDLELINNKDRNSIVGSLDECYDPESRQQRWQLYNTAKRTANFPAVAGTPTTTVTETTQVSTTIDEVASSENQSIFIDDLNGYTNFVEYFKEYGTSDYCESGFDPFQGSDLCSIITADYSALHNEPTPCFCDEDDEECLADCDCEDPVLVSELDRLYVDEDSIENLVETFTEKVINSEYDPIPSDPTCTPFELNPDGTLIRDAETEEFIESTAGSGGIFGRKVYKRGLVDNNNSCTTANSLFLLNLDNVASNTHFKYTTTDSGLSNLLTNKISGNAGIVEVVSSATSFFDDNVNINALWYKKENIAENFILEIPKYIKRNEDDYFNVYQPIVRVSIFSKCNINTAVYSELVDLRVGRQIKIRIEGDSVKEVFINNSITPVSTLFSGTLYFSVEAPLTNLRDNTNQNAAIIAPVGCLSVYTREIENKSVTVTYDRINFNKEETYDITCTYEEPIVGDCQALPFKKGTFSYWQSQEEYPDNEELYNSKKLEIVPTDLPLQHRLKFSNYYSDGLVEGKYSLKQETDFRCKKIRHFKFPDNKVAPFMKETKMSHLAPSIIYPLGINIDENLINSFLDIAVKNNLISSEQRSRIAQYEILRGDVTLDRSVQAAGLLYDIRKYKEKETTVHYSNYPFNDLGADKLTNNGVEKNITKNHNYTFHSPETDYLQGISGTEMSVQGYMQGSASGYFDEVKGHPKWVILSSKGRQLAKTLATFESSAEIALKISQAWSGNGLTIFGLANGFNIPGAIAAGLSAVASIAEQYTSGYARNKYEWLRILRDVGIPKNFASYYYAQGFYNNNRTLQEEGEKLRGIQIIKDVDNSRVTIKNRKGSEDLVFNNLNRELTTFVSFGSDYEITYPNQYQRYDNNFYDSKNASLTYASEKGICSEGKSLEVKSNVASIYSHLKIYLPSQYGNIGDIKWLTTGYIGDLKNPKASTECTPIFGGDTFITRHTVKRKIPLFFTDAMKVGDLIPFNYKKSFNLGTEPKFFVNYEEAASEGSSRFGLNFPDIRSEFSFDCTTENRNYFVPPTKFYLYYYGISNFLTESRINTEYRYAKKETRDNFFPNVGDLGNYTQEEVVSIKEVESFFYNGAYSKSVSTIPYRVLPVNYSKESFRLKYYNPNGTMYSLPDNTENNTYDPWLIFRPNDRYEFETDYGKLIDLRGIEGQAVLGRFKNTAVLFNSVDTLVDDGKTPERQILGDGGIFARRPMVYSESDLGYAGSESTELISTEFGHFYLDSERGQVLNVKPFGKGLEEISSVIDGKPSAMRNWFKEQLPFKLLKQNIEGIENLNKDNSYNGLGVSMGWDSRFKRVFITKKDYLPKVNTLKYVKDFGFVDTALTPQDEITCPPGFTYNEVDEVCEKIFNIDIEVTPTLPSTPTAQDGKITITMVGGSSSYKFTIENTTLETEESIVKSSATHTFEGLDDATYTVRVTDSNGCQLEETVNLSSSVINFDADYLVITYAFSDGRDLDTRTRVVQPNVGQNAAGTYVGWGQRPAHPLGSDVASSYLHWAGDNTGTGFESVCVNLNNIETAFPLENIIKIDCRGFWFNAVGVNPIVIEAKLYKGGSMIKDIGTFTYSNPTATNSLTFNATGVVVNPPIIKASATSGQRITVFTYNTVTKEGVFDNNDTTTPQV